MTRVAVIGPGAIGGTFAGATLQGGHVIEIAARTPFPELHVQYVGGEVRGAVHCLATPAAATPAPIVLLATKAHQTAMAAPWLRALCGPGTVLAVLQNGVEQREVVAPFIGAGVCVVPAMVACPARRTAPGQIEVIGPARLDIPVGPGSAELLAVFANSFAEVRAVEDFLTSAWTKLVLNAASGGIGVLTRRDNRVLLDPEIGNVFLQIATEVVQVGRAEGARLPADLPERMLANVRRSVSAHAPSIVVDRLTGAPTEWQARNEVVLRRAARHGIPVPINHLITTLIRAGEPVGKPLSEAIGEAVNEPVSAPAPITRGA